MVIKVCVMTGWCSWVCSHWSCFWTCSIPSPRPWSSFPVSDIHSKKETLPVKNISWSSTWYEPHKILAWSYVCVTELEVQTKEPFFSTLKCGAYFVGGRGEKGAEGHFSERSAIRITKLHWIQCFLYNIDDRESFIIIGKMFWQNSKMKRTIYPVANDNIGGFGSRLKIWEICLTQCIARASQQ